MIEPIKTNRVCEINGCKETAIAIIKTKYVCKKHFKKIWRDNKNVRRS